MDLKAPTDSPVPATHKPHVTEDSTGNKSAADTYGQQGHSSVTSEPHLDGKPNTTNNDTQDTSQEPQQTTKARESTHTPEKPLRLRLSDMSVPDLRSQAPEIESPTTLVHTPTPDGFLTCMSTSSSRTNTPDLQPYTPDFRTPTPDVSDGYFSPREYSTPSSTSDEYYECSDSPFHDHDDSMRKQDDKGSLAERSYRTEQDFQVKQRRGSVDSKTTAGSLIQGQDLTQTAEKEKEAQSQAPKRKRALNKSTALVNRGLTAGESTHEGTEPKRLSTGDLKQDKASFEGEKSDKVALRPSSVERRDRPRSTRGAEGQKSLHSLSKPPRSKEQQQSGASSSLRSGQLSRSNSAPQSLGRRPKASRPLTQAERKALHSNLQVVDDTSSPHRPPPPLVAAPNHTEASQSQQSPPSQQHPAAQGKKQNQHPQPKPSATSLQTQSNMQQPLPQNQTVSAQEANGQEAGKGPFGFSFSRLYSLKGLKDKMSKLPVPSRRSSSSSPAKGRKSKS
ncbi:nucleolar protein dao-5-like isoform X2 [Scomber japonicus]|uniref:nucleolar protein dao-5-like isoform X2 n=1 Tax=Scomber japonicus TaxID=13676 RepID=UPI002304D6C7|nr:nucleolar protein dao-5-like isoform X2 [Scomber japonicus]